MEYILSLYERSYECIVVLLLGLCLLKNNYILYDENRKKHVFKSYDFTYFREEIRSLFLFAFSFHEIHYLQ